jgi:hypothetical protein
MSLCLTTLHSPRVRRSSYGRLILSSGSFRAFHKIQCRMRRGTAVPRSRCLDVEWASIFRLEGLRQLARASYFRQYPSDDSALLSGGKTGDTEIAMAVDAVDWQHGLRVYFWFPIHPWTQGSKNVTMKPTFHGGTVRQKSDQYGWRMLAGSLGRRKVAKQCHLCPETPCGLAREVQAQG